MTVQESPARSIVMIIASAVYLIRWALPDAGSTSAVRFNVIDAALFTVVLAEMASYLKSSYRPNSAISLQETCFLFLFYGIIRAGLRRDSQRILLFLFLSTLGFWISSRALYSFWIHYRSAQAAGLTDLTSIKHLFGLVGPDSYSTGERITTLLLLLPAPLVLLPEVDRRLRGRRTAFVLAICAVTAPVVAMLAALTVTFSRGVYAAIAVFFLLGALLTIRFRMLSARALVRLAAVIIVPTALLVSPVWKSVVTTAAISGTPSQIRSLEGRGETWRNSLELAGHNFVFGVGALNFPMQYGNHSDTQNAFVTSSYNYFLEILIEKGVAGLLAALLMLAAFFYVSIKILKRSETAAGGQDRKLHSAIIVASVVAVSAALLRDLTFSSLLINKPAALLVWFAIANVANLE